MIESLDNRFLMADATPPVAVLSPVADITSSGAAVLNIDVTYSDESAIKSSTVNAADIKVRDPQGKIRAVKLGGVTASADGTSITARYLFSPASGQFKGSDNGAFAILVQSKQVSDTSGNFVAASALGGFSVAIPLDFDISATVLGDTSSARLPGEKANASVRLSNDGTRAVNLPASVSLYVSLDDAVDSNDKLVGRLQNNIRLKSGRSKVFTFKFNLPAMPFGSYRLIGTVDDGNLASESNQLNNVDLGSRFLIAAPFSDLSISIPASGLPRQLTGTKPAKATTILRNAGNAQLMANADVKLYASSDQVLDASDLLLGSASKKVKLKRESETTLTANIKRPAELASARYYLIAVATVAPLSSDSTSANNVFPSRGTFLAF